MRDLKREREQLGIPREQVAAATRIPLRYVVALEDGEAAVKHPGPFLFGYRKQYEAFLDSVERGTPAASAGEGSESTGSSLQAYVRAGAAPPGAAGETTDTLPTSAIPVARLVIAGFVATLAVVVVIKLGAAIAARPETPPPEPVLPVQTLDLRATEPTRITVKADGQTLFSGLLQPGKSQTYEGHARLEVETADLTVVTVRHNGERIEPLGNLSKGRRLVFIQETP